MPRVLRLAQLRGGALSSVIDDCAAPSAGSPSELLIRRWSWPSLHKLPLPRPSEWQDEECDLPPDISQPNADSTPQSRVFDGTICDTASSTPAEGADVAASSTVASEVTTSTGLPDEIFAAAGAQYDISAVRQWLRSGGDINARDQKRGWTLLMGAAVYDHSILVLELLQRGANTEIQQSCGSTALALASMAGSERSVTLLVEGDADVNARDQMGVTPFMTAALKGHERIADFLISAGARSLTRDEAGMMMRVKKLSLGHGHASTTATASDSSSGSATVWAIQRSTRSARRPGSRNSTWESGTSGEQSHCSPRPADVSDAERRGQELIDEEELERVSQTSSSSSSRRKAKSRSRRHSHSHTR